MKKVYHFDKEICNELVTEFSSFAATLTPDDELVIMVNSNGGSVVAGFALYDAIKALPCPTECNIIGMCASAATYPALACNTVIMQPSATFMIHEVSGWIGGTPREIRRDLDYMDDLQSRMIAMYAAKAQYLDIAQITEMVERTTYMTAQDALNYGFVDAVPGMERQPLTDDCEEQEEEPQEEKKDEGFVNRILSIFNRPKSDDIIKAPTEAEILVNEQVMKLNNELKEKDMQLENMHKSLEVKEQEFENKVRDMENALQDKQSELDNKAQSFENQMIERVAEYEAKVLELENAVKLEVANRLSALGYDAAELPAPVAPRNNADLSVYSKLRKEMGV